MKISTKRVLSAIGVTGALGILGFVIGAARSVEATAQSIDSHEERLDTLEPQVDALNRTMPLVLDGINELRKDIREWRAHQEKGGR